MLVPELAMISSMIRDTYPTKLISCCMFILLLISHLFMANPFTVQSYRCLIICPAYSYWRQRAICAVKPSHPKSTFEYILKKQRSFGFWDTRVKQRLC